MRITHTIGLGLAAGTLALGGIAGATLAQADTTPTPTASATAVPAGQSGGSHPEGRGGRHGGGPPGDLAAGLAEKLGLEESAVSEAFVAVREAVHDAVHDEATAGDGARPDPGQRDAALASALAGELGVAEADVTEALEDLRAEALAERRADFAAVLDGAVSDGTLSRAEADAVLKAADAGVIGYGGGRGR